MTITLPSMDPYGSGQISRDRLDGHPAYGPLLAAARTSGRCPVWVGDPEPMQVPEDPAAAVAAVGETDASLFLARHWAPNCPTCGCRDPFGDTFPGLADGEPLVEDPLDSATEWVSGVRRRHLAVVPVSRPADVLAAVGWSGPCNYGTDLAGLSSVLRSWEERFGAVLVQLDRSTLWLSVAAPPTGLSECRRVAAEHFAFCRDVDWEDPRPLRTYASSLIGRREWRFWWD